MDTNSLLGALMQLRRGRVLTPQESVEASSYLPGAPRLDGHSLTVAVPQWLVAQLENDQVPRHQQFSLLTARDNEDPVFMLVVQAGSTQLRLLMHMNYAGVQALLRDACSRGHLNVLLDIERRAQVSILSSAMPSDADSLLPRLLDEARDGPGQLARVLKLGAHHTLPEAVPSLLDGEVVSNVVAVLVAEEAGSLTDDELGALTGGRMGAGKAEEQERRLH